MAYFNRFDIAEAHYLIEVLWNEGGWLQERPSNRRRREATHVQLHRLGFKPRPGLSSPEDLEDNGREIYETLCERYGFKED